MGKARAQCRAAEFDRSRRSGETRQRLLAAAAMVYARAGFNGATLDDVAAEAGFTKGAVYGHFGSKENLLVALVDEHLTAQIAEQLALIDRADRPWERPIAGSDLWMAQLRENPDPFRLFVELWIHAQRDERLRERLAASVGALRAMFVRFGTDSAIDSGLNIDPAAIEQFANIPLGLSIGLAMLTLADESAVAPPLLGVALSALVRTLNSSEELRDGSGALGGDG